MPPMDLSVFNKANRDGSQMHKFAQQLNDDVDSGQMDNKHHLKGMDF